MSGYMRGRRFGGVLRSARKNAFPSPETGSILCMEGFGPLIQDGTSLDIFGAIMQDCTSIPEQGPYRTGGAAPPLFDMETIDSLARAFCIKARDEIALADAMMKGTREGIAANWAKEKRDLADEKILQAAAILGRPLPDSARAALESLLAELESLAR